MQYDIVEFVVTMNDSRSVARNIFAHILHNLIVILVGAPKWLSRLNIFDLCLLCFDARKGIAVAEVEVSFLAESRQPDGVWVDAV